MSYKMVLALLAAAMLLLPIYAFFAWRQSFSDVVLGLIGGGIVAGCAVVLHLTGRKLKKGEVR